MNYYDALIEKIKTTPGVTDTAISATGIPPYNNWFQPIQIAGGTLDRSLKSGLNLIGSEYFFVLRIPLLQGRTLTREEVLRAAHVAVISKTLAQRYFPGVDPIGRQIIPTAVSQVPHTVLFAPNMDQPYQVIGVVGDVRNDGLHRPILPQAYIPSSILVSQGVNIFVRTTGNPNALLHDISTNIRALNQNQAVSFVFSMDEYLSMFVWSHERFIAVLFGVFSIVGLGLAAIGLASVVAYSVEQRTREFGIRKALGAPQWNVLRLLCPQPFEPPARDSSSAFSSASASAMSSIVGPRAVCVTPPFSLSSLEYSSPPRPPHACCPREEQLVSIPWLPSETADAVMDVHERSEVRIDGGTPE